MDTNGHEEQSPQPPTARASVANGATVTNGATASRRGGIDRRRILLAAIEFIDENGLRKLTMRALGARLGVEAMSLYHYVPSKDSLLDGVVETVIDDLYGDPDVHMTRYTNWQDYLQRLAHGVRRMALAHPQVFPLIATRPPAAPWVQPPLRSLRWMENFLETVLDCGCDDAAAVAAYRAFSSFLLGHLLLEVSAHGVDPVWWRKPTRPPRRWLTCTAIRSWPGWTRSCARTMRMRGVRGVAGEPARPSRRDPAPVAVPFVLRLAHRHGYLYGVRTIK